MTTHESELDTEKLAALVRAKRGKQGLREAAADAKVSPSTLSRVEQGKVPDIDTFARLCSWLGVTPADLLPRLASVHDKPHEVERTTPELVEMHLRADRLLDRDTADALVTMVRLAYAAKAASRNHATSEPS